jgi:hypothetical protein
MGSKWAQAAGSPSVTTTLSLTVALGGGVERGNADAVTVTDAPAAREK